MERNSAGNQWRPARIAAGLEGFTLHDCRHFFVSRLIASGCDVVTLQRAPERSIPLSLYAICGRTRQTARGLRQRA